MANPMARVGGIIYVKVDGQQIMAKGSFTYTLGVPIRKSVVGSDGVHGYSEMPTAGYLEGEATDSLGFSLSDFQSITNATVTLELANGKVIAYNNAVFTGDGTAQTEEGNFKVRFDSPNVTEIGVTS